MRNPYYNRTDILKNLGWLLALLIGCMLTKSIAFVGLILVMLFSVVQGRNTALYFVLLISVFAVDINGFFVPKTVTFFVGQKLLMLLASVFLSVQIFGRNQSRLATPILWLLPYLIFIAIASQSGWAPVISSLKMLLFLMVFFALYGCAMRVMNDRTDARRFRAIVLCMACFVVFGSILVAPFSGISYMGAEELLKNPDAVSLFRGVAFHSQTLGPWVAMLCTLIYADWVFTIQRKDYLYLTLMLCGAVLIYKTSSRTAMASFLAGLSFVTFFAMQSKMIRRSWRTKVTMNVFLVLVFAGSFVLLIPSTREKVRGYIVKYGDRTDKNMSSDRIWGSRKSKLDAALDNWHRSPVVGNGFQVSEEMKYIRVNGIRDILSAPIEKSTWTYAILEEGGVIGMILFCLFIVMSLTLMIRRKAYLGATMLFEFLVVNLGEFGFFSMSASGGTFWCLVFTGIVLDYQRIQMSRRIVAENMRMMAMVR